MRLAVPSDEYTIEASTKQQLREVDRRATGVSQSLVAVTRTANHEFASGPYVQADNYPTYIKIGSWGTSLDEGFVNYNDDESEFTLLLAGKWHVSFREASVGTEIGTVALSARHTSFFGSTGSLKTTASVTGSSDGSVNFVAGLSETDILNPFSFWLWWGSNSGSANRTFNWIVNFNYLGGS